MTKKEVAEIINKNPSVLPVKRIFIVRIQYVVGAPGQPVIPVYTGTGTSVVTFKAVLDTTTIGHGILIAPTDILGNNAILLPRWTDYEFTVFVPDQQVWYAQAALSAGTLQIIERGFVTS